MTLTNPEWALVVENETKGWTYETFPGDLNPPYGDVWISADNFSLEWAFDGDTSPGPLEPATFQVALSCTNAEDVPPIDFGDQLNVTFSQPDGALSRNAGTGVVTGDHGPALVERPFWVTDMVSIEVRKRMLMTITATAAIPDTTLDVRAYLAAQAALGFPNTGDWETWAEYLATSSPLTYGNFPVPYMAATILTLAGECQPASLPVRVWVLDDHSGKDGHRAVGVKIDDEITLRELLDGAHALWLAPPGWDGRDRGCAFVWDTGPGGSASTRYAQSYPWDPEANAPHAAPFELTYVGSVLDSELLSSFTPAAAGSTLGIIDADLVLASPQWRKDAASSVGVAKYQGSARISTDPTTDKDVTIQSADQAGAGVRSLDSLAYLRNTVTPALDFDTSGSRAAADGIYLAPNAGAGNGWTPETFDIRPRYMTDAEWAALGPLFWPVDERQITLVIVNVDPDDDMALGVPVFLTMLGCSFSISDGHLTITPKCRPFAPAKVNGVTDAVTWAEFAAAHPTVDWTQAAPDLTWAQVALSSI